LNSYVLFVHVENIWAKDAPQAVSPRRYINHKLKKQKYHTVLKSNRKIIERCIIGNPKAEIYDFSHLYYTTCTLRSLKIRYEKIVYARVTASITYNYYWFWWFNIHEYSDYPLVRILTLGSSRAHITFDEVSMVINWRRSITQIKQKRKLWCININKIDPS
jgi:hypothetical protein